MKIKTSIIKISALLVIVGLNWTGLCAVGNTLSYFNDIEDTNGNGFSAGSLDISLNPAGNYVSGLLYQTDAATTSINISNNGSLAVKYDSKIDPLTANSAPCDYVTLNATDGTQNYSGSLLDFVSTASELASPADWSYTFTVSSSAPPAVWGKTCYFKWIFTAWSKDAADSSTGFVDVDEKSGGIRIGKTIVLNEILADPIGPDDAVMYGGEWVELYNNSNVSFNVAGWVIYDSDDSHELYITPANTNTGNTVIPAHGFLVVYRNGDSDFSINNGDETIRLYNGYPASSSTMVDSFSWEDAKPEGFSYARYPNDGLSDWVDPIPTPGEPNALTAETEVETKKPAVVAEVATSQPEELAVTEEPAAIEESAVVEETPEEDTIAQEVHQPEGESTMEEETLEEEDTVAEEPSTEQGIIVAQEPLPEEGAPIVGGEQETEPVIEQEEAVVVEQEEPATETEVVLEPVVEQEVVIEQEPVITPEPEIAPVENPEPPAPADPPAPVDPPADSGSGEAI